MLIDVHTHAPRYKVKPEVDPTKLGALWRPDQVASTAHTWDDYVAAMAPVDRAICFNIASDPRMGEPDDGS